MTLLSSEPKTSALLEAHGVHVRFGGVRALSDVSIAIPPNEIVGILGPNGAGKSTLLSVLSGLLRPNSGSVSLGGSDVTSMAAHRRARRGMSRTFQHPELFESLTVRQHFEVAYRARYERHRYWTDLLTLGSLRSSSKDEMARVDELLASLRLSRYEGRLAGELPLGVRRLIEVGRALACDPTVVLLDEPGSGLHSAERAHFGDVLRDLVQQRGLSFVLVEHDVNMVLSLSQCVYVLDFGRCIAQGTPRDIRGNAEVQTAYLGVTPDD